MQASDFTKDSPGRLAPTIGGQLAFLPNELPPLLVWNTDLVGCLSAADRALGRLAGLGQDMPNPHLLIRPFLRREAVLSSQIEGTQASMPDLLLFEVNPQVERDMPDVREVSNYVHALEYGLERVKTLPLSLWLIREMHKRLLAGVRGEDNAPGEFRTCQVHIGPRGAGIEQATFVPPPPSELNRLLGALERYLHEPSDLPPVVRLALVHYQFETIHPFRDGNGRIGRLLISLMLCLEKILPMPLLYLSAYFQRTRQEYYEQLRRASQAGTWNDWLTYFARGVASEAMDAVDRAQRLKGLQARYVRQVRTVRTSALLMQLIEELFNYPMVSTAKVAELLKVTPHTAQTHIDRLAKAGILRETTGQKRNRLFVADGIIKAVYDPTFGKTRPAAEKG
ncbi:MAG: Fic family protein [Planctomycetota bacterium]|nr:Fic family protein [Planctomycetota bacterium]